MSRVLFCLHARAHFPAYRATVEALLRRGAKVRLYYDARDNSVSDAALAPLNAFLQANPDVACGRFPLREDAWAGPLEFSRNLKAYHAFCRRSEDAALERWLTRLRLPQASVRRLTSPVARALGRLAPAGGAAALVERLAPPSREIVDWVRRKSPVAVVVAPGHSPAGGEMEVARAAHAAGVRTVLLPEAWDGLCARGLLGVEPDLLLVWNELQKDQAVALHGVAPGKVRVTGAPLFDPWRGVRDHAPGEPRRILYLGSSRLVISDESWVVAKLKAGLERVEGGVLEGAELLFWPHPAADDMSRALKKVGVRVLDRDPGRDPREVLAPHLADAFCVVGVNARGLLDAVACDKPTVLLQLEEAAKDLIGAHGLDRLVEEGAVKTAATPGKAAVVIAGLLRKDSSRRARRRFAETHFWPAGAPAGEAQAEAILALAPGKARKALQPRPAPAALAPRPAPAAPVSVAAELQAIEAAAMARKAAAAARPDAGQAPTVTLGLPAYNEEKNLERAVRSLLDQSYGDFELILADNASSDRTLELMRRLQATDGRIRILTSERNLGAIANFRRLLESARGQYFAWVGAHDAYDRDWLGHLVEALAADPRLAMVYAKTRRHLENGELIGDSALRFDSRGLSPEERARRTAELSGAGERIYGLFRTAAARAYPIRITLKWDTLFLAGVALVGDAALVEDAVWYRSYHARPVDSPWHTAETLRRQLRIVFRQERRPGLHHHVPGLYHQAAMLVDGLGACRRQGLGWGESLRRVRAAMRGLKARSDPALEIAMLFGLVGGRPDAVHSSQDLEYAL